MPVLISTVWLLNYVIVNMILMERSSPICGRANLEGVELKTSFGLMSLELVELQTIGRLYQVDSCN